MEILVCNYHRREQPNFIKIILSSFGFWRVEYNCMKIFEVLRLRCLRILLYVLLIVSDQGLKES